ncbi:MAG: metallophosphoesterase [Proteobacteria bacterium]|nr:metallophosphoesterase [Pseudomonadota bacterium]MBU4295313.1 metallophosphoesterase [Pseudomonadota bacterium]MCG2748166.1 metallophosphoesterase [Desulfobulbaceae bacterium]
MILFLAVAISIYTAMHCLVFWGIHPLLAGHRYLAVSVLLWMLMMIISPFAVRLLDTNGSPQAARLLALTSYTWMGLLFLAFCLFAVIGMVELLSPLPPLINPAMPRLPLHGTLTAATVLLFTLVTGIYGYVAAKNIRVVTVPITTDKLPAGTESLRVVQVSDLHLGLLNRGPFLATVITRLKELKPDLLVATGDVIDAQINHLDGLDVMWQEIEPPLGKFAVIGNHEVYAGLQQSIDFLKRCGFVMLRNTGLSVGGVVRLIGIDDEQIWDHTVHETAILQAQPSDQFTIFLKHRPTVSKDDVQLFDLQLSGHAHRGQIFPFNFVTGLKYPMQDGLYCLSPASWLYTSRGTGTWGPPMRVLSPPEITVFDIRRGKSGT